MTEAGNIPKDWGTIKFKDCFDILPNNTLSRANLNCDEGKVKNIHYGDILVKFGYILDCHEVSLPFVNFDAVPQCGITVLKDGDIIIADTAEDNIVGKTIEIVNVGEGRIVSGLHTIPCRIKQKDMFASRWLGYFMNHNAYHNQILNFVTGIKVSSISKKAIADTVIVVPPLFEQTAIANALSDMDALIETLRQLIVKKKNILQGVMQELLTGKRRLPGFDGEWSYKKLGDIGKLFKESINPQMFPDQMFSEYSMPAFDNGKKANAVYGMEMKSNRIAISGSVLLFNKLNVRQKRVWLIKSCDENAVCSAEFLAFFSETFDLRFIEKILLSNEVTSDFVNMSTGTSNSQQRINPKAFLDYEILVPLDMQEQREIGDIFDNMDAEIAALEFKLQKYENIKSGMMEKLLTGQIRLV